MFLWGYVISKGSSLDGIVLKDLRKHHDPKKLGLIVAIFRGDDLMIPRGDDRLIAGDHIYVLMPESQFEHFRELVHPETENVDKVVISGATRLGLEVARRLEEVRSIRTLVMVEKDRQLAEKAADQLTRTLVLHGNITDRDFVTENEIGQANYFLALGTDDTDNLTNAMLIRKAGVRRVLVRSENDQFLPVFQQTNFGEVINPRRVTVSDILRVIRRGNVVRISQVGTSGAEVREYEVTENQLVVGKKIRDLKLPKASIIGAIQRKNEDGEEIRTAGGDTEILAGDHVIIFALPEAVEAIEKLFTRRRGFLR